VKKTKYYRLLEFSSDLGYGNNRSLDRYNSPIRYFSVCIYVCSIILPVGSMQ